jgi:hypothetical protein
MYIQVSVEAYGFMYVCTYAYTHTYRRQMFRIAATLSLRTWMHTEDMDAYWGHGCILRTWMHTEDMDAYWKHWCTQSMPTPSSVHSALAYMPCWLWNNKDLNMKCTIIFFTSFCKTPVVSWNGTCAKIHITIRMHKHTRIHPLPYVPQACADGWLFQDPPSIWCNCELPARIPVHV